MINELQERIRHYSSNENSCHYCKQMTSKDILDGVKDLFRDRIRLMRQIYPEINEVAKEAFRNE
jgi:hypothetical protein